MKQQRYLIHLLLLGCLLYSCEGSNEEGPAQDVPLRFSCEVQTRGTQTATDNLVSMGVVAYHTDGAFTDEAAQQTPNFMNNQSMNKVDAVWKYSPVKYWPQGVDKKVSFFAYAPFGSSGNGGSVANGLTVANTLLTYTTPSDASAHPDLLVATPLKDQTQAESNSGITFRFEHMLACVSFSLSAVDALLVTSIKLNGVRTQGSLSLHSGTPVWSLDAMDKREITYTLPPDDLDPNKYLMLLPQTLASDVKVTLTLVGGETKEVSLTGIIAWEKNKRYNYNLQLPSPDVF